MEPGEIATTATAAAAPPGPACLNCGTPLTGPFCARCGQHVADYHRSVWRFVTDFLDNTFCWDNKLLRTLWPLLRQPGGLTVEFMAGRRVRYVHPLRLFLFTSAVCLALLHYGHSPSGADKGGHRARTARAARHAAEKSGTDPAPTPEAATPSPTAADTPVDRAAVKAEVREALKGKLGAARAAQVTEEGERIVEAVQKKVAAEGEEGFARQIGENIQGRLSWVALAMLPVFAFMLRGLYWQEDSYYFLHLVFSLHYHTFLLMFWTVYSSLRDGLDGTFLHSVTGLGLWTVPVYLFLALRRVYGGSARRTWLKVFLLGAMHLLAIFCALGLVGGLAFFAAVR